MLGRSGGWRCSGVWSRTSPTSATWRRWPTRTRRWRLSSTPSCARSRGASPSWKRRGCSVASTTPAMRSSPSTPAPAAPTRRTGPRSSCGCTCAGPNDAASRSRCWRPRRGRRPGSSPPPSSPAARTPTASSPPRPASPGWSGSRPSTPPPAATPASPRSKSDFDLGEAGVAAGGGVEGRDPDQPGDAGLGGEEAVGVLAAGDEGGGLEPGLLPRRGLQHLDLEAASFGPAQVHPQEDLGPVLRVGAAGAGVDGDDRIAGVVLATEQPRLFQLGEAPLDRAQLGVELSRHLLVLVGHLRQVAEVGDVRLQTPEHLQPPLRPSMGSRGPSSGLLVVPEPRTPHLLLQPSGFLL